MIYMDNASTSFPKPVEVIENVAECIAMWCANPGRAGYETAMKSNEEVYKTRKEIAELIGEDGKEGEIIFTNNCTAALNMAIKGILKKGDHVITTMMEHNSVMRPLYALRKCGVETSLIKCTGDGTPELKNIEKAIKKNTKLMIVTLSSNVTGTIMPIEELEEIAEKKGIKMLIDAAQGMGSVELKIKRWKNKMIAASGHKGLLGPQGTGFLYVNREIELKHLIEGGTGTESLQLMQTKQMPEGYESGTLNLPGIKGLQEGVKKIKSIGIQQIRTEELKKMRYLEEELRGCKNIIRYGPREAEKRTSIFSFNIENKNCEEVAEQMDRQYQIAVRAGYHCAPYAHHVIGTVEKGGCVRVSPGYYTTMEEIKRTAEAIRMIAE